MHSKGHCHHGHHPSPPRASTFATSQATSADMPAGLSHMEAQTSDDYMHSKGAGRATHFGYRIYVRVAGNSSVFLCVPVAGAGTGDGHRARAGARVGALAGWPWEGRIATVTTPLHAVGANRALAYFQLF